MNIPTHIAFGACLAQWVASGGKCNTAGEKVFIGIGVVVIGMLSHLALDLLPHYAWIVYLDWFKKLPYHWLIRESLFGLVIVIFALYFADRAWPFVVLGITGAMYPDIEKILCVDFGLPESLVIFDWHSSALSSRTGGLPKALLITAECMLVGIFLLMMWKCKTNYGGKNASNHKT